MSYYGFDNQELRRKKEEEARMNNVKMKNRIIGGAIAGVILVGGAVGFAKSSETIKPGYAGIVYSLNGGIEKNTLSQGLKFFAPWKKVRQYPVSTEQITMSRLVHEGKVKSDESFNIPSSDGKTVNVDFDFSYHFDAETLATTFTNFRGKDADQIENEYIKPKMKGYIGDVSSKFSVLEIYGDKRGELAKQAFEHAKVKFAEAGIVIDSANFTRIDPDAQTAEAIQKRINSQQALEQEKVEAEKAKIEATKKAEIAKGEAEKLKIEAQGQADAAFIKAQGDSKANKELQQSITPQLIQKMEMEARLKHGWITIQGGTPVVNATK